VSSPLTRREEEVLHLLFSGKTNSEIATALYISRHTAREHMGSIYAKLEVHTRSQLFARAVASGLLTLVYKGHVITGQTTDS
jgi:DNA-binding CsgD family transcriptional regulator